MKVFITLLTIFVALLVVGCYQERPSKNEPIHFNPNMDIQPKYRPQAKSAFFEDGSTMRQPVPGTVARGELRDDVAFFTGKDESGNFVKRVPATVDAQLLARGQERYDIYCSPCHSRMGDGRGIMVSRKYVPPPSFHDDRIRKMPDGQVFDIITNGIRNMPSYRHQIKPGDRWAIVAYVRALQRSQNAKLEDIPEELRDRIEPQ